MLVRLKKKEPDAFVAKFHVEDEPLLNELPQYKYFGLWCTSSSAVVAEMGGYFQADERRLDGSVSIRSFRFCNIWDKKRLLTRPPFASARSTRNILLLDNMERQPSEYM